MRLPILFLTLACAAALADDAKPAAPTLADAIKQAQQNAAAGGTQTVPAHGLGLLQAIDQAKQNQGMVATGASAPTDTSKAAPAQNQGGLSQAIEDARKKSGAQQ